MQHIVRNIVLIVVVLVVCLMALYPPSKNLRKGKDLAGGVSLVYTVDIRPDDPPGVLEATIEVLKERVDPQGLFEISFVPVGRNRIEITMPLPGELVEGLRDEYQAALDAMAPFELDRASLGRALRKRGDVEAIGRLATGPELEALLAPLQSAAEAYASARAELEALQGAGAVANPVEVNNASQAAADAREVLDSARRTVLLSVVTRDQISRALNQPDDAVFLLDRDTGRPVPIDSIRKQALDSIRERLSVYPGGEAALDNVIEKFEAYEAKRSGFDDPSELQRLLRGSGVLEFRIAPRVNTLFNEAEIRSDFQETGRAPDGFAWRPVKSLLDWVEDTGQLELVRTDAAGYFGGVYRDDRGRQLGPGLIVEEKDAEFHMLVYDQPGKRLSKAEGEWSVARGFPTTDEYGRRAIGFEMDTRGAQLLGDLTSSNTGQPMAVVLDNRVYTAPGIRSRISTRGIIEGSYTAEEVNYIVRTLNAGSLQARLGDEPISKKTLAPTLGQDNLERGMTASWIALLVVFVFMVVYYFSSGLIAGLSLVVNAVIILGVMSLMRASFTLPGIAGVVLTFGMAVDANVLIYERIREELAAGNDLRIAVRTAFKKVLSTIVDANITNLIVCVVLAYTATQEIKGFAITLGIGVIATMFSSLFVARVVFAVLTEVVGLKSMPQLPSVVPAIDRALSPSIDWIRLRPAFIVISTVAVGLGVGMIVYQGAEMLDTEFRGGTKLTVRLKEGSTLDREAVQARLDGVASAASARLDAAGGADAAGPEAERDRVLADFGGSATSIVPVDPGDDGVTSDEFELRTVRTEEDVLQDAVREAFGDVLATRPGLSFRGDDAAGLADAPVGLVIEPGLAPLVTEIRRSLVQRDAAAGGDAEAPDPSEVIEYDVTEYRGGIAILLDDLSPQPTRSGLVERLRNVRASPEFADEALPRQMEVVVIEGSDEAVESAVILVRDEAVDILDDAQRAALIEQEWGEIALFGLTQAQTLDGVEKFSAAMASTFRAKAIVAVVLSLMLILVYIWIRFGSVRYSIAAITALTHDVVAVIGLIALAEIVYDLAPWVGAIGIQPFKIDLGLIAALMTIIGYSLNDTIIILDRIRENRGRLPYATKDTVNLAINQTISRTLITSGTTFCAVLVMFLMGGSGIASFTYALLCGVVVGTYSSVAVAAPLVFTSKLPPSARASAARREGPAGAPAAA